MYQNEISIKGHKVGDGEPKNTSVEVSADGPFLWTKNEQGLVLGSYFWGYFVTQVYRYNLYIGYLY